MPDRLFLARERRFLGITERRWQWIGRRTLIAAGLIAWGFAAYQFGAQRGMALVSSTWDSLRLNIPDTSAPVKVDAIRSMPACFGPIRFNCVVDGDTAWVTGEKIRISGIDAPEIDGKCTYERDLAQRAKSRLSELLSAEPFSVSRSGTDRYGRSLATIYLRDKGDVGAVLVRDGLARVWTGRRMPWC
jgi:hypothetical protein